MTEYEREGCWRAVDDVALHINLTGFILYINPSSDPFRQIVVSAKPPVTLRFDVAETLVYWQEDLSTEMSKRRLPFGYVTLFGPEVKTPTPFEIESAIELVEEHVMSLAREITTPSSRAVLVQECPVHASTCGSPDFAFDLDAVEREFSHIAAVAHGRPYSNIAPSGMRLYAACVLIVREFMHHLRIGHGRLKDHAK